MEQPQQDHNEPRSNEPQLVASPNNSPWEARVPLARHVTFRVIRLLEEGTLREFVKEVWPSRNVDLAAMQASEILELIIQHLDELPDAVGCLEAIEKAKQRSDAARPPNRPPPPPSKHAPPVAGSRGGGGGAHQRGASPVWGEPGTEGTPDFWSERVAHRRFCIERGAHIETRPEFLHGTPAFLCFFPDHASGLKTIKAVAEKFSMESVRLKAANRQWARTILDVDLRVDTILEERFPIVLELDFPSDELLQAISRGEADPDLQFPPAGWWQPEEQPPVEQRLRFDQIGSQDSANSGSSAVTDRSAADAAEILRLRQLVESLSKDRPAPETPARQAAALLTGAPIPPPPQVVGLEVAAAASGSRANLSDLARKQQDALQEAARKAAAGAAPKSGDPEKGTEVTFDPFNPSHVFKTENTPDEVRLRMLEEQIRTLNDLGGHSQVNHDTFLEYFNASTDLVMQSPLVSSEDKIRVFTANQRRVRHLQGLVALGGLSKEAEKEAVRKLAFMHSSGSVDPMVAPAEDIIEKQLKKKQKLEKAAASDSKPAEGSRIEGLLQTLVTHMSGGGFGGGGGRGGDRGGGGGRGGDKGGGGGRGGGGACFYCKEVGHKERDFQGRVTCPERLAGRPPKN